MGPDSSTRRRFIAEYAPPTLVAAGLAWMVVAGRVARARAQEKEQEQFVRVWNGDLLRKNPQGGFKIFPLPGLRTESDDNSFHPMLDHILPRLGMDWHDVFPHSYEIDETQPDTLGVPSDWTHSTRDPRVSLHKLNALRALYTKQFEEDWHILLGHSQGGDLAVELADMYPENVAAVITLDSPLFGADIVPVFPDENLATLFGGEAAAYYTRLAHDTHAHSQKILKIRNLQRKGIPVVNMANTLDRVVNIQSAHYPSSNVYFKRQRIQPIFAMYSHYAPKAIRDLNRDLHDLSLLGENSWAGDSARLQEVRQQVLVDTLGHFAVLGDSRVHDTVQLVIEDAIERKSHGMEQSEEYRRSMEEIHKQEEELLERMSGR